MTTLNLQVAASADDAYQASAGTTTINDTYRGTTNADRYYGSRWQNVAIPRGSTINSAYEQLYFVSGDDPRLDVTGEIGDAAVFTTDAYNISSRAQTTAKVDWDADNVAAGFVQSPDLKSVLQEIVNDASWASGNDLVLINKTTTGNNTTVYFWDYSGNARGAKLDVDFTPPAGGLIPIVIHHLKQQKIL